MYFGKLKRNAKQKVLVFLCATLVGYLLFDRWEVPRRIKDIAARFRGYRCKGCSLDHMIVIRAANPLPQATVPVLDPDPPTPCALEFRRRHVQNVCKTSPPPRVNTLFANYTSEKELVVSSAIFDLRRRTLGCLVNKVASTSWYKYLANHSENATPKVTEVKRYRLMNYGLDNRNRVPLSSIRERTNSTWKSYMFVRHPLQRLVSAYSHTVKKQRRHDNITFDEYMEKLASGEFTDYDIHWSRYSSFCHPCDIDYDYIIKMETLDIDMKVLNKIMGIDERATFSQQNKNKYFGAGARKTNADTYPYDQILVDFQRRKPRVFNKILQLYRKDMDMYGYGWDVRTNSTCGYANTKHSCC